MNELLPCFHRRCQLPAVVVVVDDCIRGAISQSPNHNSTADERMIALERNYEPPCERVNFILIKF